MPFPEDRSDPLPVASHPALKIFSGKPQEPIAASQFGCDLAIVRSVSAVNPRVRELRLHSFSITYGCSCWRVLLPLPRLKSVSIRVHQWFSPSLLLLGLAPNLFLFLFLLILIFLLILLVILLSLWFSPVQRHKSHDEYRSHRHTTADNRL